MVKYINNTTAQAMINGFKNKFGNNSALKTTSKNFVGAINELKLAIANLPQPQHISQDYSEWYDTNVTSGSYSNFTVTDTGTIIGSSSGNVVYSEDSGKTWQQGKYIYAGYTSDMRGNYNFTDNNGIIIAGSVSGSGIKYSEDGGKTWQDTNITRGRYEIYKTDTNTLIAENNIQGPDETCSGIKYSEDGGKTWQNSNITDKWMAGYIAYNNTLIAGIAGSNGGAGIKYSEDGGKTWQNSNITSSVFTHIIATNNGILLAGENDAYTGKIRYSEDGGKTWQQSSGAYGACYQGFFIAGNNIITFTKNGNSNPAAQNVTGLKYSEDNGKTWQIPSYINSILSNVQIIIDFAMINNTAIISTDLGVAYSEDFGKTWQRGDSTLAYCSFIVTDTGTIIASVSGSGIKYSEDDGKTWQDTNVYSNGNMCIATDGTVITSSNGNGIKYCYVEN